MSEWVLKPDACRLLDGRIGVFVGAGYVFLTKEKARKLAEDILAACGPEEATPE